MTTNETLPDYVEAADKLRALLASFPFGFAVEPGPGTNLSERGQQRFTFSLVLGEDSVLGSWFCGSGVALHAYIDKPFPAANIVSREYGIRAARAASSRLCVDDAHYRVAIRKAFRPSLFDVVSSLLLDCATVSDYLDWEDWADSIGERFDTAAAVVTSQECFALMKRRRPILRRMLGARFDEAVELAGRL